MIVSRIPKYDRKNLDGMLFWFAEISVRGLLFHPDDAPRDIIEIAGKQPLFTADECVEVETILADMFTDHGDDVIQACYPIYMSKAGLPRALDS